MSNVAYYELGGGVTKWVSHNNQSVKATQVEATDKVAIAEVVVAQRDLQSSFGENLVLSMSSLIGTTLAT